MDVYPGNSISKRTEKNRPVERATPEPKPVEKAEEKQERRVRKVVAGKVTERNKSLGRRFRETFFEGEGQGVLNYILFEVLIPAAKDIVVDVVTQTVERSLGVEGRARSRSSYSSRPSGSSGYVNYGGYSSGARREPRREEPRYNVRRERNGFQLKEWVFESHHDADEVLRELELQVDEYGHASVMDYYDAIGLSGEYTDDNWGWRSLQGARIKRIARGEFVLDFPSPERLD